MTQSSRLRVRRGFTSAPTAEAAAGELGQQVGDPEAAVNLVFASPQYDLHRLGPLLDHHLPGLVVGCTTAGEIAPTGYATGSICAVSLTSPDIESHALILAPLTGASRTTIEATIERARRTLDAARHRRPNASAFGLLLIDGLSVMEEQVIALLAAALDDLPLVGGSAGDELRFGTTHVLAGGAFAPDQAVLLLVITTLPFSVFKTQHFQATDQRLVITRASPEQRLVQEVNGRPAADEYARVVGVPRGRLGPELFSNHPLMLRFGGEYYVRSIQKAHDDGSLTFYCAIDEGVVLRLGTGKNLVDNLGDAFAAARRKVDRPVLTIGCDCILRRLEITSNDLEQPVNRLLRDNHVIGFSTYGEQFGSLHVNQTFTGIMLGDHIDQA